MKPTYVGVCGVGVGERNFTQRLQGHVGTATQPCHQDTVTPVGRHFRLPGHHAHGDIQILPIEVVSKRDIFLMKARETFNIVKLKSEKQRGVKDIEHGLNLDPG